MANSSLLQASENVQAFARQYKALMDIAQIVQNIGNLENYSDELKRQIDQLRVDKEKAAKDTEAAILALADMQKSVEEAKAIVAKAEQERLAAENSVVEYKADLVAKAEASADKIVQDAIKAADAVLVKANAEKKLVADAVTKARAEETDIQSHITQLKNELAALKARF